MFRIKNTIDFEKKSVFLINFFLTTYIIFTFLFSWSLELFFYVTIFLTLGVSYIFFKRSRKVAKTLIVTNLFIFFYFLSPQVSNFLHELFGVQSYLYVLLYSIILAYIFLVFSGNHKKFLGDWKKFDVRILGVIIVIGIFLGLLFYMIKEPIPSFLFDSYQGSLVSTLGTIALSSFVIALAEQMIFAGFLFNSYRGLTTKSDAYFQTAIIFFLFHILRFELLVQYYFLNFDILFIFYISAYYLALFMFMLLALALYSYHGSILKGNFFYPLALHFVTDFSLFAFYILAAIL